MIGRLQAPAVPSLPSWDSLTPAIKKYRWLSALAALIVIAALLAGSLTLVRAHASTAYVTQPVAQQDLSQTVTASGTVNPQNTVDVGTQVSGTISAIYVDYNSKVKKGQVLAQLDTSQLQAQLAQAQASLAQAQDQAGAQSQNASGAQASIESAQAGIQSAASNVTKAQSALQVAQTTVSRDRTLLSQGYIAQSQMDTDQSNFIAAQSAVQAAQAALDQSRAQNTTTTASAGAAQDTAGAAQAAVSAAQAQVQQDQLNIDRATITSPVDGTVIARDVSVGQTVAASLQAPTLFSIAQDLHKMEVDISVGEPDIGNVRAGDPVSFSVLAYPNQTFTGKVTQVRINPTTVNNVVTYTVVTQVGNGAGQLLPGMTANASIAVKTVKNALVVPTQALSFRPAKGSYKSTHRRNGTSSSTSGQHATSQASGSVSSASPWGQTTGGASASIAAGGRGMIFTDQNGKAVPVPVTIQLVSGAQAAVVPLRGSLTSGDEIIVSDGSQSSSRGAQSGASSSHSAFSGGAGGMGGVGRAIR